MKLNTLGNTKLEVSEISFGASSLGSVFKKIDEEEGIRTVHAVVEAGINYIDVAPAYGGTLAESVLGQALKDIDRKKYYLSTKAGKYTNPKVYGDDTFDYTEKTIIEGLEKSMQRLGVDYVDIVHLHDFDYCGGQNTDSAFATGFPTLQKLKEQGVIGSVGAGIYDMGLWKRVVKEAPVDAILVHNHYCLNDTVALDILEECNQKNIGIINASPFASGLLTPGPVADWHPANIKERALVEEASAYCEKNGTNIATVAFQFSTQQDFFATTMFSSSSTRSLKRNLEAFTTPLDKELVKTVQEILTPIMQKQWDYDSGSGLDPKNN